jgi:hypothetical protein
VGGAGLTEGAPLGVPTALDAAPAIRDLWLSWPYSSIVADRATGIYARGEQIVHIDYRGAFDIAGPLTVPTTPQVAPVLAWYAQGPGVILRPAADEPALARFLDDIASARTADGIFAAGWTGTLRERLSLPVPPPLTGGRPAFPAPDPAAAGTRGGRGGR